MHRALRVLLICAEHLCTAVFLWPTVVLGSGLSSWDSVPPEYRGIESEHQNADECSMDLDL
jgi:hypothetical protein